MLLIWIIIALGWWRFGMRWMSAILVPPDFRAAVPCLFKYCPLNSTPNRRQVSYLKMLLGWWLWRNRRSITLFLVYKSHRWLHYGGYFRAWYLLIIFRDIGVVNPSQLSLLESLLLDFNLELLGFLILLGLRSCRSLLIQRVSAELTLIRTLITNSLRLRLDFWKW